MGIRGKGLVEVVIYGFSVGRILAGTSQRVFKMGGPLLSTASSSARRREMQINEKTPIT
jgi:hypothetical protein